MSDSYHQTLKSVFGGKSSREIDKMILNDDPDLLKYIEKKAIKKEIKKRRKALKELQKIEPKK